MVRKCLINKGNQVSFTIQIVLFFLVQLYFVTKMSTYTAILRGINIKEGIEQIPLNVQRPSFHRSLFESVTNWFSNRNRGCVSLHLNVAVKIYGHDYRVRRRGGHNNKILGLGPSKMLIHFTRGITWSCCAHPFPPSM